MLRRSNRGNGDNQQQGSERSRGGSSCDRGEAVAGIERGAGRSADREGREHRGPDQAMTLAVLRESASASPQLTAAVMTKLSAVPSRPRPRRRTVTEIDGVFIRPSDNK